MQEITPDMAGRWLDGVHGWRNYRRAWKIAREFGYTVKQGDQEFFREFESESNPSVDVVQAVYEIVEEVTEFLNDHTPEGYGIHWHEGDLVMMHENDFDSPFFGMDVE